MNTGKMGSALLAILLLTLSAASASVPAARGMAYFSLGLDRVDNASFQARLDRTGAGYPRQPKDHLSFGGGALFCGRRLVIGIEGLALFSPDRVGAEYRTSLSGACGVIQVGYAVLNSETFTLYPLLGFGGGAFTWKVQRNVVPTSFEETIRAPEMGVSLFNASFLLQAALGADYWLALGPGGQGTSRVVLGLRLGYSYSPFGHNWEIQLVDRTQELDGAPDFGINGPFLRIVVGWGRVGRTQS